MGGNPRENVKDRGFWDGGSRGHGVNGESSGRARGYPGWRRQTREGVRMDLTESVDQQRWEDEPRQPE